MEKFYLPDMSDDTHATFEACFRERLLPFVKAQLASIDKSLMRVTITPFSHTIYSNTIKGVSLKHRRILIASSACPTHVWTHVWAHVWAHVWTYVWTHVWHVPTHVPMHGSHMSEHMFNTCLNTCLIHVNMHWHMSNTGCGLRRCGHQVSNFYSIVITATYELL